MSKRRTQRKRSKGLILLLLPALIFIGFVGWLICALEPPSRKNIKGSQSRKAKSHSDDGLTFMPAVYEEQLEVEKH